MSQFLSGVDRAQLIRWTAFYLLAFAVVNVCGGIAFGILGGLSAGVSILTDASGLDSATTADASSALGTLGGMSIALAILYFVSVPVFAVSAYGLFRRTSWARIGAVVGLAASIVLSLLTLNSGLLNILWILISAFGIYLFWTDEGIKRELSR